VCIVVKLWEGNLKKIEHFEDTDVDASKIFKKYEKDI
jgi:hypothetical protein